jgi:Protein of unknown function (DUF3431)
VRKLPWEAILVVAACAVILYNEYRLMVQGLIWGITGILFIGVSRALFAIGSEYCLSTSVSAYHGFVIMTLMFGMLMSGILMIRFEMAQFSNLPSMKKIAFMFFNMACFIGTAFSGSSFLVYTPISFDVSNQQFAHLPIRSLEFLPTFISNLLVLLVSIHSTPVVVSWIQLAVFLTAAILLLGFEEIHNYISTCLSSTRSQDTKLSSTPHCEPPKANHLITITTLSLSIFLSSWAISNVSTASINDLPPPLTSNLDTIYHPTMRFEIVVSMYDELPEDLSSLLSALKTTELLSKLSPTITIYTKHPSHSHPLIKEELKQKTGADKIEHLENLGREGGTYLHHIVTKWDELAEQTLFIQAHAHNVRELIPRINSYLIPESGFLSLGFAGITCSCGACSDRWGWEDKDAVIPDLFERIHGMTCEGETPILLTYKGQFVASARRIRGIEKSIYEELLKRIMSKNLTETGGGEGRDWEGGVVGENTPDNPYFGFTVERTWGLLVQCATDQRIAAKCPTLLSGMGRGGEAGDCGCLDVVD